MNLSLKLPEAGWHRRRRRIGSGAYGGLLGAPSNKARISLNIHIVDSQTLDAIAEGSVQGQHLI